MNRRLAAILAADVVGYSRLMSEDEQGTLDRLRALRQRLVQPAIEDNGGRIVKLMGDGVLAEFGSVVAAVECAIAIQSDMNEGADQSAGGAPLTLRIGVNAGDVIVEDGDIYGDGVNVAARLEAQAPAGGVCISDGVYREVRNKLNARFDDLGKVSLKNIPEPLRLFAWEPGSGSATPEGSALPDNLPFPEKPSIAILPFENRSSDPEQEFFADGVSEDIITELSRFRSLFVIARNSSFSFRGKSLGAAEISRQLGVRYIVEGSVRRAGNRVRVSAQLIDAVDNVHLWADRYDRDMEDIFQVQDDVVSAIVRTIEPHVASHERQRAMRKPTSNLDAWENYQRGMWHAYHYSVEECERAIGYFNQAIVMDDKFSLGYAGLAFTQYIAVLSGAGDRDNRLKEALAAAQQAIRLDPENPFAHVALGRTHTILGQHDAAIAACDAAISLNPSFATAHFGRAHSLWHSGRAAEALDSHEEAMRLSPRDPMYWAYLASKAIALVLLNRMDEAIDCSRRSQQHPNASIWSYLGEISALGLMERRQDARQAVERMLSIKPDVTVDYLRESLPMTDAASSERFFGGLAAGGVPPGSPSS